MKPLKLEYKQSSQSSTCWLVASKEALEKEDNKQGTVAVTLFIGPNAKERAKEYSEWINNKTNGALK